MTKKLAILTGLLFSLAVVADDEPDVKISAAEGDFAAQRAEIERDIDSSDKYQEISGEHLKLVRTSLDEMSSLLDGIDDVEDLNEDARNNLINHQELVNTILTMAEMDSRVVCRRRGSIGTHFKTTHCETIKQRRQRQRRDLDEIDRLRAAGMICPQCGN